MCLISEPTETILPNNVECDKLTSEDASGMGKKESISQNLRFPTTVKPSLLPWVTVAVWPLMSTLPLLLTEDVLPTQYSKVFPSEWYNHDPMIERPKPLGLILGICAVVVGHMFLLPIFYLYRQGSLSGGIKPTSIQTKGERKYEFFEGLKTHLTQPEGFILLSIYLSSTWMMGYMPSS